MNLPSNLTEAQILKAIESVVSKLARSFKFGYHTLNDMKQQGYLFAIDGMTRYDPNRKLENFLYSHLKNRYINFIRDNYKRNDPTCKFCHTSITCPNKREGENFLRYLCPLAR
jgi:DNA-directed RNA polymerase specialized sigma subunit